MDSKWLANTNCPGAYASIQEETLIILWVILKIVSQ
jgi:hypothetical protein